MAAYISVPYTILMDGGITESNEPGQPIARVKFKCLTSDHYQLIRDLAGQSQTAGGTGSTTGAIIRIYPFSYPPSPNLICLAIESVEFKGPGYLIPGCPSSPVGPANPTGASPWVVRKWAYVTARFGLATFFEGGADDPSGQPYTTTTFETTGDSLTLPNGVYAFPSGATTSSPVSIPVPQMQITQVRHMMPYPPIGQKAALYGLVNNAPVYFAGFAFPTGTLVFLGGPDVITCDTAGNVLYETTYIAMYRPQPWNYALSPKPGEGWALITDSSGNPPLASGDFSTLP